MYKENNSKKHYAPAPKAKRRCFIIALAVLLCTVISAVTLAFVFTNTGEVKNTFNDTSVIGDVVETFEDNVKKDVKIKNNGDTSAYIRATVVVTWLSDDKKNVSAKQPVENADYTIAYNTAADSNWQKAEDGYWYYKIPVAPGAETKNLINECKLKTGAEPPAGYSLSVEIIASVIQSTPNTVVKDKWDSGVEKIADDGTTLVIKQIGG